MNKAVFLDRDGVINNPFKNYYVYKEEHLVINKGVIEALQELQEKDYLLIIISNQGGISKGIYTIEQTDRVHQKLQQNLEMHGIHLSAIYYCPHHSKKEKCLCRKPEPLMLEKAMALFNIDPELSYFIGDKKTDMEAGKRAGIKPIRVRKNQDLRKILKKIN